MKFDIRESTWTVLLGFSCALLSGQDKVPVQVPLEPVAGVEIPSQYRVIKPIHCDLMGRLHALAQHEGGSPIPIRIDDVPKSGEPLHVTAFGEPASMFESPAGYSIYDYAPDTAGGLYAIAIERNRKATIVHFGPRGLATGVVHAENIVPKRLAVFADGSILILGLPKREPGKDGPPASLFIEIVSPDGKLLHQLAFDPSSLSPGLSRIYRGLLSDKEWEDVELHVELYSSKDRNVYVALPSAVSSPAFGGQSRLAAISPAGEVRLIDIPAPRGTELFGLVLSTERLLGLFGTRATDSSPGIFDDLREFSITNDGRLQLSRRYRVLGAPECLSNGLLLVIRPDEEGLGGASIMSYQLPAGEGRER